MKLIRSPRSGTARAMLAAGREGGREGKRGVVKEGKEEGEDEVRKN